MSISYIIKGTLLLGSTALLGAACERAGPAPATSERNAAAQFSAEVSMTAAGFSPEVLTVAAGTAVAFKNADFQPHRPASDPHPVHTDLPGFDAKAAIVPDGAYSFTFSSPGTYSYHDHLNPSVRGQIVVQNPR